MANLTITIEDGVLKRARMRALEQDTSVNALLRDYLVAFAGGPGEALGEVVSMAGRAKSGGGKWKREDVHGR